MVMSKMSNLKRPTAPPVYRPQPVSKVLQAKSAMAQPQTIVQSRKVATGPPINQARQPVAPPVYRPQPAPRVVQKKSSSSPGPEAVQARRKPIAPPIYRPQAKKVVQPKIASPQPQSPTVRPQTRRVNAQTNHTAQMKSRAFQPVIQRAEDITKGTFEGEYYRRSPLESFADFQEEPGVDVNDPRGWASAQVTYKDIIDQVREKSTATYQSGKHNRHRDCSQLDNRYLKRPKKEKGKINAYCAEVQVIHELHGILRNMMGGESNIRVAFLTTWTTCWACDHDIGVLSLIFPKVIIEKVAASQYHSASQRCPVGHECVVDGSAVLTRPRIEATITVQSNCLDFYLLGIRERCVLDAGEWGTSKAAKSCEESGRLAQRLIQNLLMWDWEAHHLVTIQELQHILRAGQIIENQIDVFSKRPLLGLYGTAGQLRDQLLSLRTDLQRIRRWIEFEKRPGVDKVLRDLDSVT